ncbi:MAG: SDR family oxidoreductase [Gammaproteobacteria bacterium]|nr:SDR family oxidoreductase [Gammaproteobacteria bacterium]
MDAQPNRRWIVTGASRGIGLAVARRALAAGDRVALFARSPAVQHLARDLGDRALGVRVDVSDPAEVEAALATVAGGGGGGGVQVTHRAVGVAGGATVAPDCGGVDVLVNNAGLHRGGLLDTLSDEDWDSVLNVNLSAPFRLIRALRPRLTAGSAIVNVGAVVGFRGFAGDSPYGASKAGLAGLTRVLAVELARHGIRVNLVVPGFVSTAMTAEVDERARERIHKRIPMRREGTEMEIAEVICWVAGASYMTGAVVPVDGGLSANL